VGLAYLLEVHFLFELVLELARHGTGTPDPAAYLAGNTRQLFRSQHDECEDENNQDLREADVEHAA
jgi:hypothetical protein